MLRAKLSDHNHIIENRYSKAEELEAGGTPAFVHRWIPSHQTAQAIEDFDRLVAEETAVRVAGRIMTLRRMGKAAFFHLLDGSGRVQVYARRDTLPKAAFDLVKSTLDLGDIVGIEGTMFTTKTGEKTVQASNVTLLTKSMRPLPEKYHGLKDVELRFRHRYVDLFANPEVRDIFRKRAAIIRAIRAFLDGLEYLEVETPMMQPIHGGATARPFATYHNALDMPLYLRIAPELYLKRLLVGGFEKVYEINRNFRNEGISTRHNPEFTMLELYTAYWDYNDTMDLTEQLIRHAAIASGLDRRIRFGDDEIDLLPEEPWARLSVLEAIERETGLRLDWGMTADEVRGALGDAAPRGEEAGRLGAAELIMRTFEEHVEHTLAGPVFIKDFPAELSPLAKAKKDDPRVAERFELFIGRLEMANAYSELNDPGLQYRHFEEQLKRRAAGDEEAQAMDEDYVRSLEYGMPPASGLGIGIDRLTMLFTNQASIREVILFPLLRQIELLPDTEESAPEEEKAEEN